MTQFSVHRNGSASTARATPYLLNIQSDLIDGLETRVVVPLVPASAMKGRTMTTLTPVVEIAGKSYVIVIPQLAGVTRKSLGPVVADLSARRGEILASLDLLISGI